MATEDRNEPTQDVKTSWSVILSMLSYVLLMGVIGVPIWWKTTEVYRVALPFDQISNLDHDLSLKPKVNVRLISAFEHGDHSFGLDLVKKFEGTTVHLDQFFNHIILFFFSIQIQKPSRT